MSATPMNDPSRPPAAESSREELESELRAMLQVQQMMMLDLQAILDNAAIGILYSRNRSIERCNRRGAEIFGYTPDELGGKPAVIIYPSQESYQHLGRHVGPLLTAGQACEADWEFVRKDGSSVWCHFYAKAVDAEHTDRGTVWIVEDITAARATREILQKTQYEIEAIMLNAPVGVLFTRNRHITRYNRRFAEMFGFDGEDGLGQPGRCLFRSDADYDELGHLASPKLSVAEPFQHELFMRRQDGRDLWANLIGYVMDPAEPARGTIWLIEDRSAVKQAEEALRNAETLQRAILDSASLLIVATDADGRIVSCNPATERLTGYRADELTGRAPSDVFLIPDELESHALSLEEELGTGHGIDSLLTRPRLGRVEEAEWTFCRRDGSCFPVRLTITPLRTEGRSAPGFLFVAADITERRLAEESLLRSRSDLENRVRERTSELEAEVRERRKAEEKLRYLAHYDSLTGLPNRNLLQQTIREAVAKARASGRRLSVMFVDLDRFKHINDSLGHHVGDALLMRVAHRLQECLRGSDTVSRIGGDEFVVVAADLDDATRAVAIAEKMLAALRPAFRIDGHDLFITPSIGICTWPRDGDSVDALMRNADTAMYQAKAAGRNTYRLFEPSMNVAAEQYFQIESSLRQALDAGEFRLHYQPIVATDSGALKSLEVLVRWQHPQMGLLAPAHFISVAEESGLIGQLGEWVLRQSCSQLRQWHERGLVPPPLAVNLSPLQFRDRRLSATIGAVLADSGLAASAIDLEITETALMHDGEQTLDTLKALADLGFGLSIDDFGTGYSSLAYLKRFPVSKLKVDRSFVKDMTNDDNDRAIVRTVIALADSMHLGVVAEGVETSGQLAALQNLGCHYAQGYLFSRPVAAADIEARYLAPPVH